MGLGLEHAPGGRFLPGPYEEPDGAAAGPGEPCRELALEHRLDAFDLEAQPGQVAFVGAVETGHEDRPLGFGLKGSALELGAVHAF